MQLSSTFLLRAGFAAALAADARALPATSEEDPTNAFSLLQHRAALLTGIVKKGDVEQFSPGEADQVLQTALSQRQSPCEWCQTKCISASATAYSQCSTARHCDALADAAECDGQCKFEAKNEEAPCLDACPCSDRELDHQETDYEHRIEKAADIVAREPERQVEEIRAGAALEPEEEEHEVADDGEVEEGADEEEKITPDELDIAREDALIEKLQTLQNSASGEGSQQIDHVHETAPGQRQSPCEWCQTKCISASATAYSQCSTARHCDALADAAKCDGQCKSEAKAQEAPCLDACPCSDRELDHQETDYEDRIEKAADNVAREPERQVEEIRAGAAAAEPEEDGEEEQEEANDDEDEQGADEEEKITPDELDIAREANLHSSESSWQKDSAHETVLDQRQSPCEWCQTKCLTASASAYSQCSTARNCDALAGAAECDGQCKSEAKDQEAPCLDACPCSDRELDHQETDYEHRIEKAADIVAREPERQVEEIRAGAAVEPEEGEEEEVGEAEGEADGENEEEKITPDELDIAREDALIEKLLAVRSSDPSKSSRQIESVLQTVRGQRQSPCEWCQTKCLTASASAYSQCSTARNCDALAGAAECDGQCKFEAKDQEAPCLDACPCSDREMDHQEKDYEHRIEKAADNVARESERQVEEIRAGAAADPEEDGEEDQEETDDDEIDDEEEIVAVSPDELDVAPELTLFGKRSRLGGN